MARTKTKHAAYKTPSGKEPRKALVAKAFYRNNLNTIDRRRYKFKAGSKLINTNINININ
jgi:hypothetical protein